MKRLSVRFAASLAMMVSMVIGAPVAFASDTECRGTIAAVRTGAIIVPDGAVCRLNGTQVQGNVTVKSGATLLASDVRVEGNIQAEGAKYVELNPRSFIVGNVELKQGGGALIDDVRIDGDLQLESNDEFINVRLSDIGGSLQAKNNDGGVRLTRNTIRNNLQCQDNDPAPTGGRNSAKQKEGQCERL